MEYKIGSEATRCEGVFLAELGQGLEHEVAWLVHVLRLKEVGGCLFKRPFRLQPGVYSANLMQFGEQAAVVARLPLCCGLVRVRFSQNLQHGWVSPAELEVRGAKLSTFIDVLVYQKLDDG